MTAIGEEPPARAEPDAAGADQNGSETDRAKRWSRAAEDVRSRADVSAKAIGALGTTALSAVGIAKFGDLFPLPAGDMGTAVKWAVVLVPLAFFAMAFAIVAFSMRLWRANEPILMSADPSAGSDDDLDDDELKRVRAVYAEAMKAHGGGTLAEYEQQASALEQEARTDPPPADSAARLAKAKAIRADVDEAQQRALLNVARLRARNSVKGFWSIVLYALFAVGLVTFAIGTDYLDSERSARVTAAKACADAVDAVRRASPRTARLVPPICGRGAVDDAPPAPASTSRAELTGSATDLATRWDACRRAARADKADAASCAQIGRGLALLVDP